MNAYSNLYQHLHLPRLIIVDQLKLCSVLLVCSILLNNVNKLCSLSSLMCSLTL
jgi:hypothetical protein